MGGAWQDVQSVHTSLMWCLYPLTLGWSGVSLFFFFFFVYVFFFFFFFFFKNMVVLFPRKAISKQFFWKRFWRIYPPYFAALVVFYYLTLRHLETGTSAGHFWLHLLLDRKSTRLNSSHANISYAVF